MVSRMMHVLALESVLGCWFEFVDSLELNPFGMWELLIWNDSGDELEFHEFYQWKEVASFLFLRLTGFEGGEVEN